MSSSVKVLQNLFDNYQKTTPQKLKIVDAYMFYILLTGIFQFIYCVLVGTFPFNAFLSGFISTVASFVLAACLRIQVNEENKEEMFGMHMRSAPLLKKALTKPAYWRTYGTYGATAFLLAVYICDWKAVGQYIPLWNKRYISDGLKQCNDSFFVSVPQPPAEK
ncbi:unnamed protein product, partial [Mesorhabditis spiculigera]